MTMQYTEEQLKKMDEIMDADWKAGIIFDKIKDDPQYPFSQLDILQIGERTCDIIPISDQIIIDKTPNEIRGLFIIILVLSVLLFYFAFIK